MSGHAITLVALSIRYINQSNNKLKNYLLISFSAKVQNVAVVKHRTFQFNAYNARFCLLRYGIFLCNSDIIEAYYAQRTRIYKWGN